MRRAAVAAMLAAPFPAPAFAQAGALDTHADGPVSFDERRLAHPDMGPETLGEVDASDDGLVTPMDGGG